MLFRLALGVRFILLCYLSGMKRACTIILLLCVLLGGTRAQEFTEVVEMTGTAGSGGFAPMWHLANRQGVGCIDNGMGYLRNGIGGRHWFGNRRIGLDWGFDFVAGAGLSSRVYIQQAFVDVNWRRMRVSIGQKERWSEFGNRRLTTGALVESGNARPIPQVRIELPRYWSIPGTDGWIGIKGHLAYGMFTDGSWQKDFAAADKQHTENVLYHSKAGFIRLGNVNDFKLSAEFGLHMVTQFGGTIYDIAGEPGYNRRNPTRLKDFLLALVPLKGDREYNGSDQANVAGNVLGSWMGAVTWDDKAWKARLYYDHVFEDHSQMFWEYGLWTEQLVGVDVCLKRLGWIENVTLEYFNLKNQSGPIYHDSTEKIPDQISCKDNNYNHDSYAGWFNYGMIIGTPLCTSPIYNKDGILVCSNNRVEAFHFGVEGSPADWLGYRLLFTHSNNWGTYGQPFTDIKQNTSGLVELTLKPEVFKGWSVAASFAFDKGDLYGNNYGGMLSIGREFVFDLRK